MKNESKTNGGIARALSLTSERRKEIAQKAARSRWKNHQKAVREPPKKIKGISNKKYLVALIKVSLKDMNMGELEILENNKVIRKFNEQTLELVNAKIEGYLSALQDLGVQVEIQINKVANMEL